MGESEVHLRKVGGHGGVCVLEPSLQRPAENGLEEGKPQRGDKSATWAAVGRGREAPVAE